MEPPLDYREHPVYKNYYISKSGGVWSSLSYKTLKRGFDGNKYYAYSIRINNKTVLRMEHRLVMETWGNDPPTGMIKPTVDHIDNNKYNNHIDNLQWLSLKNNIQKSYKYNPRYPKPTLGSKHYLSKLSEKQVLEIREKYNSGEYTQASLSKDYCISIPAINRKTWKHI